MNEANFKDELMASIRQNLEEGLTKQAGVELSDAGKAFIDQTLFELEKEAGFGSFVKEMVNTAVSTTPVSISHTVKDNLLDANGRVTSVTEQVTGMSGAEKAGLAMAEGFGQNIPRALVPLGVGMGLLAAFKAAGAISNQIDKNRFDKAFAQVLTNTPTLKEHDPVRVQNIAQSIFRLAPHVAVDPMLLGPLVVSQVNNAAGIDPNTLRSIVELEDKIRGRSSFGLKPKELLAG